MLNRNHSLLWVISLVIIAISFSRGQKAAATTLTPDGQKVVDYLLADWQQKFRSTTIPHAMTNLGMEITDDLRLRIIGHLRSNPNLASNLRYWGANNYLLTNQERRIAKYLLNSYRDDNRLPDLQEMGITIGADVQELSSRLAFMESAGLLAKAAAEPLGYGLAEGAEQWGGPLRHNFHTIAMEGQPIYDVW